MHRIVLLVGAALAASLATAAPASAQVGGCWINGQRMPAVMCRPRTTQPRPPVVVNLTPPRPDWRWRNNQRYRSRPVVVVQPNRGVPRPAFRPGAYVPQPLRPPKQVRVGGPRCADGANFNPQIGLCVAREITRIDMPPEHKAYLANCPGTIETRVIPRDGVMVEQQRCVRQP